MGQGQECDWIKYGSPYSTIVLVQKHWLEPTIFRIRDEHAIHYTTDTIRFTVNMFCSPVIPVDLLFLYQETQNEENSHSLSNQSFELEIKLLYFTDNCLTFLLTGQLIYNWLKVFRKQILGRRIMINYIISCSLTIY